MQSGVSLGVKGVAGADVALGKRPGVVDDAARRVNPCLGAGVQRLGVIGLALAPVVTPLLLQLEGSSQDAGDAVEEPSPGAPRPRPAVQAPMLVRGG